MRHEFPHPFFNWDEVDPSYPCKARGTPYEFSKKGLSTRGITVRRALKSGYGMGLGDEDVIVVVSHSGFMRVGVTGCKWENADARVFGFPEEMEGEEPTGVNGANGVNGVHGVHGMVDGTNGMVNGVNEEHKEEWQRGVDVERLVEWELTEKNGGALGISEKGKFGWESQLFPMEDEDARKEEKVESVGEVVAEKPKA